MLRTLASVVAIVPRSWISEMSRLIAVTRSCCRVLSIRKPRSSGCVSVALNVELNVGLKFAKMFDVTCLLLLNCSDTSPPPQRSALRDAGVVGGRVVLHDVAAVQLVGRRVHERALTERRVERRPVGGAQPRDVQVEGLRVEPFDGELQVALERARVASSSVRLT